MQHERLELPAPSPLSGLSADAVLEPPGRVVAVSATAERFPQRVWVLSRGGVVRERDAAGLTPLARGSALVLWYTALRWQFATGNLQLSISANGCWHAHGSAHSVAQRAGAAAHFRL